MWHTFKRIGIFTFCMLITQLIKAQLRYSQLENIEMINLKLVLCLPLILIDGANMVDFVKSSVLQGMLFWFFLLFNLEKVAPKFRLTKYKNMISRTLWGDQNQWVFQTKVDLVPAFYFIFLILHCVFCPFLFPRLVCAIFMIISRSTYRSPVH